MNLEGYHRTKDLLEASPGIKSDSFSNPPPEGEERPFFSFTTSEPANALNILIGGKMLAGYQDPPQELSFEVDHVLQQYNTTTLFILRDINSNKIAGF
jgi:hypothetical protein